MFDQVIQRRGAFMAMVTAVVGIVVAVPFTLIHPVLPFAICLGWVGMVLLLRKALPWPKYTLAYWTGGLVALVLLFPLVLAVHLGEQGFDDGPFYGQVYTDGLTGLEISDRIDYRQGELAVYNRREELPPVLAYRIDDETRWAMTLDVSQTPGYEDFHLSSVEDFSLLYGIFRDRLSFIGQWSFGQKQGRVFIWKWGQFHRFYLRW